MTAPLPPGSRGLPLLGETLDFAKDSFAFVRTRRERYGPIFRTNVLGRNTAVISGPDSVEVFIDQERIQREGAMPPHIQELFGGRSLPLLDGDTHRARKQIVLAAFNREALAAYLPVMQGIIERAITRWSAAPEIGWVDEFRRLALEAICTNVAGITDTAELDALRRDYMTMTASFATLPIRLPGTKYTRALAARARIFAIFQRQVAARRTAPKDDGLSRMLKAAASLDPSLGDHALILEIHHAVIAGFIVFAELTAAVIELTSNGALREALLAEIRASAASGPLDAGRLISMPVLRGVVMETKRLTPIIPAIFGRARTSFTWNGVTVPKGWMVLWDVIGSNRDPKIYTGANGFDAGRYAPGREEHKRHPHAYTPQGGGPPTGHLCAGVDYSTVMMGATLVLLLRSATWTLPPQDLSLDCHRTPPEPRDGLRAVVRTKS